MGSAHRNRQGSHRPFKLDQEVRLPICSHRGLRLAVMTVLPPRSTLAGAIGNTVEWFDFAVYGYFAREIGEAFFPADVPSL